MEGLYPSRVAERTFGENLKRFRERKGISQEKLGRLLGNLRPSTVQSWEKDRRQPEATSIQRVAAFLDCTPAELIEGVLHDWDRLRGWTVAPDLTAAQVRLIKLWATVPPEKQAEALDDFVELAARHRHDAQRQSSARTAAASTRAASTGSRARRRG